MSFTLASAKEHFSKLGQEHIFEGVEDLSSDEIDNFLATLQDINLDDIALKLKEGYNIKQDATADISPFSGPQMTLLDHDLQAELIDQTKHKNATSEILKSYHAGIESIANSEVAVLLMAGGQGSRLGFNHPKGMFPFPPIASSIFSIHAQRIHRLLALAKQAHPTSSPSLPWIVMTSAATDAETREFFKQQAFFGLPEKDVFFFQQGALPPVEYVPVGGSEDTSRLPVIDVPGQGKVGLKLILEAPGRLALSPNGNGGLYAGLSTHLSTLTARGIQFVHIVGVDNVLVRVADPLMVGFMRAAKLAVVNKVVARQSASEKVGVMARRGGRTTIVEYSELGNKAAECLPSGELTYSQANIGSMLFHISFLQSCAARARALPWHLAENKTVKTFRGALSACKMEMFMFDVLEWAGEAADTSNNDASSDWRGVGTVCGRREHEFAPVKNADSAGVDCPASARAMVLEYYRELLRGAGRDSEAMSEAELVEVGMRTYAGEGLVEGDEAKL